MQPEITEAEINAFLDLLNDLPDDKRDWFVEQMVLMSEGKPNAIEGTADVPAQWPELEGYHAARS